LIRVFVEKLTFECVIGLLAFERERAQEVEVDVFLDAEEFVDYAFVCEAVKSMCVVGKFEKVEDVLEFFCEFFKKRFATLRRFEMKLTKTGIIANARVGARVVREFSV